MLLISVVNSGSPAVELNVDALWQTARPGCERTGPGWLLEPVPNHGHVQSERKPIPDRQRCMVTEARFLVDVHLPRTVRQRWRGQVVVGAKKTCIFHT